MIVCDCVLVDLWVRISGFEGVRLLSFQGFCQFFKVLGFQGFRVSRSQGFGLQGFSSSGFQGFTASGFQIAPGSAR